MFKLLIILLATLLSVGAFAQATPETANRLGQWLDEQAGTERISQPSVEPELIAPVPERQLPRRSEKALVQPETTTQAVPPRRTRTTPASSANASILNRHRSTPLPRMFVEKAENGAVPETRRSSTQARVVPADGASVRACEEPQRSVANRDHRR